MDFAELLQMDVVFTTDEIAKLTEIIEVKHNINNYQVEVRTGSKPGDNFIGLIYKITVIAKFTELHFIVKCSMRNVAFRKLAPIEKFYQRECYMYTTVLPIFEELQQRHKLQPIFKNYPQIYGSSVEFNNEFLIMEDLHQNQFRHLDRTKPLNLAHCLLFMTRIGQFHGLSFALKEYCRRNNTGWNFNEVVSEIREDIFTRAVNRDEVLEQTLLTNARIVRLCFDPVVDGEIIEKVQKFGTSFVDAVYELTDPKNIDQYSVIIHGDCWTNNLMFKYENNTNVESPAELYFIDFQESRHTSGIWDVTNFMCTSMDYRTMHDHFNELINTYYQSINDVLIKMQYQIDDLYPYHIFEADLHKYFQIGVGLAAYMQLPLLLRTADSSTTVTDIEEAVIAEQGNVLKALHLNTDDLESEEFKNRIGGVLRFAYERNFI